MSSAKQDATRDRIEEALVGPLSEQGLDVEAVEVTPAGKRRVLRVAVDKDGGVTLDDVADATRAVSEVLDASDVMGEMPYTLEVTSRGVDRPADPAAPLAPQRRPPGQGDASSRATPLTGRITTCDETSVTLDVDGAPRVLPYADVAKALVQIEFNRKQRQRGEDA